MFSLHHFFVVAALSGAVFPFPSFASELDEYEALKTALVRSAVSKDRPLPKWIKADDFEPRPHYHLDDKPRPLERPPVESVKPDAKSN